MKYIFITAVLLTFSLNVFSNEYLVSISDNQKLKEDFLISDEETLNEFLQESTKPIHKNLQIKINGESINAIRKGGGDGGEGG